MTRLLVLGRIQKPIPADSTVKLEDLSNKLKIFGDVYSLPGFEGFAAILDVDDLGRLEAIFMESEFAKIGRIEIFPLAKI